jgi:regulator of sigma E protease
MIDFVGRLALTLLCLGLVVVIHEFGHFVVARLLGVRVEKFTVGFGPEILGWTGGATRYAICAIPLGGMVKMAGEYLEERENRPDEFFSQAWYRRIAIALAGPFMNYVLAFVLFAVVAGAWGVLRPSGTATIGDVIPGLPAATATLKAGDTIQSVDGTPVQSWEQMAKLIHARPEKATELRVSREGTKDTLKLTVTPRRDPSQGIGLIGVVPKVDKVKPGFKGSIRAAARDITMWTVQPLQYLSQKIVRLEAPRELSSPLGIAQMVSKATKEGVWAVLQLVAIISTGLGLFNLFPIPILDGGHVVLYLFEGLLRRPLSRKVMQTANLAGLSLVAVVFFYALYQDIVRWRGGFWN